MRDVFICDAVRTPISRFGGALAKVVWLFASVAASWNPGWYYILDPNGAHQATLYMFAGSIAQAALMVAVAIAPPQRRAHEITDTRDLAAVLMAAI